MELLRQLFGVQISLSSVSFTFHWSLFSALVVVAFCVCRGYWRRRRVKVPNE